MHAGEHHPSQDEKGQRGPDQPGGNIEEAGKRSQQPVAPVAAGQPLGEPFQKSGGQLHAQHQDVGDDADAHFEENRIPLPVDDRLPDVPVAAQVNHQNNGLHQIAQPGGQQCRAQQRAIALTAGNIHEKGAGETAGGQGDTAGNIDGHPDAPGVLVVQVGGGGQTEEQPGQRQAEPEGQHSQQGTGAAAEKGGLDALVTGFAVHRFYPDDSASPPFPGSSVDRRRRLSHIQPPRKP